MSKMKSHLSNAAFGIVDYLAYPIGMLLLAPVILRSLGMERYGIWAMANAVLNLGAIVASGFGDANIRATARAIESGQRRDLLDTVRSTLGIHIIFGLITAFVVWMVAPVLTRLVTKGHMELHNDCLVSLRIIAALVFIRAVETVSVSTQRAYARYGAAIQISVAARFLSLIVAALVPLILQTVSSIMIAVLFIAVLALWCQLHQLKLLLGIAHLAPSLHPETTRALLRFGVFAWLQSVAGLLFSQVDRIVAGIALGSAAISAYTFCAQLTQPIYGLTAAGLHFLFPHLASRSAAHADASVRISILKALSVNITFVAIALSMLIIFGKAILRVWGGPSIASAASSLLPIIAWSSALSALGVTGSYASLAIGKPGFLSALTLASGLGMIAMFPILIPHYGLAGIAYSKLLFGPCVLVIYVPIFSTIRNRDHRPQIASVISTYEEVEMQSAPEVANSETLTSGPFADCNLETEQSIGANVLGVEVDAIDMERAISLISKRLLHGPKGYVCAVSVHGILEALRSQKVATALREAAIRLPDGTPTVWIGRLQGHRTMNHVTGPAIMREVFRRTEFAGCSHFLYGGGPCIADELAARLCGQYPWVKVIGTYTPPFRDLTPDEEAQLIARINCLRPDIVWVGISTPRQDLFMQRILPNINTGLMLGVGAAFDFLTGRIRNCPDWVKRAGLHWLHRLLQDPRRLWRRNLRNTAFLWHITLQLSGLRTHSHLQHRRL